MPSALATVDRFRSAACAPHPFPSIPTVPDDIRRNQPERSADRAADAATRLHVRWREILKRGYLAQLLTLCLAIWLLGTLVAWRFGRRIGRRPAP